MGIQTNFFNLLCRQGGCEFKKKKVKYKNSKPTSKVLIKTNLLHLHTHMYSIAVNKRTL